LVSCYAHAFVLLSVVIVAPPLNPRCVGFLRRLNAVFTRFCGRDEIMPPNKNHWWSTVPLVASDILWVEMSLPTPGEATPKRECPGFEPQQWRRGVCKNCFRSAERHGERHSVPETQVAAASADSGMIL